MGFHLPVPPWESDMELPQEAMDRKEWNEKYRMYYVPSSSRGIDVKDLMHLFEQAKLFRGQR